MNTEYSFSLKKSTIQPTTQACTLESEESRLQKALQLFRNLSTQAKQALIQQQFNILPIPQLSRLANDLKNRIKIDFIHRLPTEMTLRIFQLLDAKSVCRSSSVSKAWNGRANDDVLWHRLCHQHVLYYSKQSRLIRNAIRAVGDYPSCWNQKSVN
jgi:hypothetical protein